MRLAALGADEVVGILAGGKGDEAERAAGADMGQGPKRRADRRLLARRVAVEAEDRGRGEAPEQAELGLGERGAERRDRLAEPGLVERDHVHLPLDDDHPLRLAARRPRPCRC